MSYCAKCKEKLNLGQPDPCLGLLPNIAHACCGHGKTAQAYCIGWKDCKPNESCVGIDKPWFDIVDMEWKHYIPEGYVHKRGLDAIIYMNTIKFYDINNRWQQESLVKEKE